MQKKNGKFGITAAAGRLGQRARARVLGPMSVRRTDEHERRGERGDGEPENEALAVARGAFLQERTEVQQGRGARRGRVDERDLRQASVILHVNWHRGSRKHGQGGGGGGARCVNGLARPRVKRCAD